MSKSHKHNLDLIIKHMRAWRIDHAWKNVTSYPDKSITEVCDVFGVTQIALQGLWIDANGRDVYVPGGTCFVGEYKDSKADLRADHAKPCRRRDVKAMGDYRLIWIREDGPIEPHDIDEEGPHYGWGVVVFNEVAARIVREPLRMSNDARWESMRVYGERLCIDHQAEQASTRANIAMNLPRPAVQVMSAPRSETIREETGTYACRHAKAAEVYVAEAPCSTSELRRHLSDKTGWQGSPDKLTKHLKQNSKKLVAPRPGGNWMIK